MSKEGVLFRKIAAFNEISLLVFSLVAFVFIIGETQRVSADRFTADNKNLPKADDTSDADSLDNARENNRFLKNAA